MRTAFATFAMQVDLDTVQMQTDSPGGVNLTPKAKDALVEHEAPFDVRNRKNKMVKLQPGPAGAAAESLGTLL